MHMLIISASYLYRMCRVLEGFSKSSGDFLMYALSNKHNPYLIGKKLSKINILASNFFTQMFSVSNNCVSKVSDVSAKAVVQVDFPTAYLFINKMH